MTPSLETRSALTEILEHLLQGNDLSSSEAAVALDELVSDTTPATLKGAFLVALRAKGETPTELAGLARALLRHARLLPRVPGILVDTCGTGGDGRSSFNLSTAAALLLAALDVAVAKHGNRAVSSRSGSADLAAALGLARPDTPAAAAEELTRTGFVFLFAPSFHPATAAIGSVRRELGVRTVFNQLGPLVNPARPSHQLIGAADGATARRLAEAARLLGIQRAMVVHGQGFDEATPCGPFELLEVAGEGVKESLLRPEDFGLQRCKPEDLVGGDAHENAARWRAICARREHGPVRDAVCLNAALVLLLSGRESEPRRALRRVAEALDDGRAERKLEALCTRGPEEAAR